MGEGSAGQPFALDTRSEGWVRSGEDWLTSSIGQTSNWDLLSASMRPPPDRWLLLKGGYYVQRLAAVPISKVSLWAAPSADYNGAIWAAPDGEVWLVGARGCDRARTRRQPAHAHPDYELQPPCDLGSLLK